MHFKIPKMILLFVAKIPTLIFRISHCLGFGQCKYYRDYYRLL